MFVKDAWLFIDTHEPGRFRLGWLSASQGARVPSYRGRPVSLMRHLFLRARADLRTCLGVCVVEGPGPFSSIRIGVLYANLLARLLRIPLVPVAMQDAVDLTGLCRCLSMLKPTAYVAPVYDREPNITMPRV